MEGIAGDWLFMVESQKICSLTSIIVHRVYKVEEYIVSSGVLGCIGNLLRIPLDI